MSTILTENLPQQKTAGTFRRFFHFFGGMIVRPGTTVEELAQERTIHWALLAACLPILQVWGNILLHAAFGQDWLGTRGILPDPTFVGAYGQWQVKLADWLPVFAALLPLLGVLGLLIVPGIGQLMSKIWGGKASFEQMVNVLTFAVVVPNIVINGASEWLFGVPIDLLTGHHYWWVAAMNGELGQPTGIIWNIFVFGIYLFGSYAWTVWLGSLAIRRVQRIPLWTAILTMLAAFLVSQFVTATFVR
ncbi:MAG TPA: YIP1 family protein [Chloroflexia bacterium]|nr:YIP1 family protein [Chloroflexia bacterium]